MSTTRESTSELCAVPYDTSGDFAAILEHLNSSLLVSSSQADKLHRVGSHAGQLQISFLHVDQAMGLADDRQTFAFGSRRQINFLYATQEISPRIPPVGTHDGCRAIRQSHYTGNIQGHDMAWGRKCLWVLDSGRGVLTTVDQTPGKRYDNEPLPGYPRGLSIGGQFAFSGLSNIRGTKFLGRLPNAERPRMRVAALE